MSDEKKKSVHYRKVASCPKCSHVVDIGVDEEVLLCKELSNDTVEHDGICDLYKPQ